MDFIAWSVIDKREIFEDKSNPDSISKTRKEIVDRVVEGIKNPQLGLQTPHLSDTDEEWTHTIANSLIYMARKNAEPPSKLKIKDFPKMVMGSAPRREGEPLKEAAQSIVREVVLCFAPDPTSVRSRGRR